LEPPLPIASRLVNTLAVCDTEPIAIEGLRSLLESGDSLRVVACETTLPHGMDAVMELEPSMLLIDKAFGLHPVMDLLKKMRESAVQTRAIIWGYSLTEAEALRLLQTGAAGVIRKTMPLDALLNCMQTVASGCIWMEDRVLQEAKRAVPSGHSTLTARELQVMELVETGLRNKDIAVALGIRTGTVKIHLKHIFEKTGIRGRYGLALSGLKEKGLLAAPLCEPARLSI